MMAELTVFNGCQKEEVLTDLLSNGPGFTSGIILTDLQKNQVINELAGVLAHAVNELSVREFLHAEIAKQFTNDYDILYALIRDQVIHTEKYGMVSFDNFLLKVAQENHLDIGTFRKLEPSFKNLQISSPVYFEDWDFKGDNPVSIGMPVDYDHQAKVSVQGYDKTGRLTNYLEDNIKEPILLIRKAERVDDEGKMRVDFNGFVIEDVNQSITAKDAYEQAGNSIFLKSVNVTKPTIQIIEDDKYKEFIDSKTKEFNSLYPMNQNKTYDYNGTVTNNGIVLKSTNVAAPTITSAFSDAPYSARMNWNGAPGAEYYQIWRNYGVPPNSLIATVNKYQNFYVDNNLNIDNLKSYFFGNAYADEAFGEIEAYYGSGERVLSNPHEDGAASPYFLQ